MRKFNLTIALFLFTFKAFAGEGMWLPFLLQQLNEKDMKAMGLKISAADIYSVNKGSLKDAVLIFGSGCTGEVVSNQGLVLTNHHCGYGTVNGLSTVEKDYMTNGFFAKNQADEIPCPGLSVRFIRNIEPVTNIVTAGTSKTATKEFNDSIIDLNIKNLIKEKEAMAAAMKATEEGGKSGDVLKKSAIEYQVKGFFYDNEYYLFTSERFTDVRLVAFPPNGIGKFGGDTDNWAWPRHTGDFGLFRIYANEKNEAADYNSSNKPYKPLKHFKINIGGVKENDFSMVYGFPGRTQEYLTSDGIHETMNVLDPARIKIRAKRLNIIDAAMKESKENFIKYASKQAGIANYYKKWQGELLGLTLNDAVNKKRTQEDQFMNWVEANPLRKEKYAHLIGDQKKLYQQQERNNLQYTYVTECLKAPEFIQSASLVKELNERIASKKEWNINQWIVKVYNNNKGLDKVTDRKIANELFGLYQQEFGNAELLSDAQLSKIYDQSIFKDTVALSALLRSGDTTNIVTTLANDPMYATYYYIDSNFNSSLMSLQPTLKAINENYKMYIQGIREYSTKPIFPDANFTLRVSYGKVQGLDPQDGMKYNYYTTLGGAVRKRNDAVEEFNMPQRLVDIYQKKDFGRYAIMHKGQKEVPVCFLSSLHTTGGNSGSPVLNAYGELIGTNFDRIWEGTMSDILYDINLCRNITVDIRYTLFIIEKFGDAKWVVDEMDLVDKTVKR